MSEPTKIEVYKERLDQRLRSADLGTTPSKLGIAIADQHWLVDLAEAGEVLPIPDSVAAVPATTRWFKGLANLRGALYGVSDLSLFQGGEDTPCGKAARLVAFSSRLEVNAAILVSNMLGLQNVNDMQESPVNSETSWIGKTWVDGAGTEWRELSLARLCLDEQFLSVSR